MAANSYGSVDVPAGNNDHYDEDNTRYLNQTPFQWGRFLRAVVPILIALFIMGGFGYGMSHGFSHLYGPPKSGDDSTNIQHDTSWIPESGSANGELSNKGDRQCSKHASCGSLGGNCCPSDEGIMLDCCG